MKPVSKLKKILGKTAVFITLFLIGSYKYIISPILPPACRFYPSCSQYAVGALKKHGFLNGSWLAVLRILRCNPLFPGGYDPVP